MKLEEEAHIAKNFHAQARARSFVPEDSLLVTHHRDLYGRPTPGNASFAAFRQMTDGQDSAAARDIMSRGRGFGKDVAKEAATLFSGQSADETTIFPDSAKFLPGSATVIAHEYAYAGSHGDWAEIMPPLLNIASQRVIKSLADSEVRELTFGEGTNDQ